MRVSGIIAVGMFALVVFVVATTSIANYFRRRGTRSYILYWVSCVVMFFMLIGIGGG